MITKQRFLIPGMLLAATLACAIPGSPGSSGNQLSPEDQLATSVVGTAAVLQTQTAVALPPTETLIPVSTSTMVPTTTFTPTATATPVFSLSGSALVDQEDGSTRFIDQFAGYEIMFPSGWLAVRANEQEYYEFWTTEYANNPVILAYMNLIGTLDSSFRLNVFDIRQEHIINSFLTRCFIVYSDNQQHTIEEVIEGAEVDYSSKYKLLTSEILKTSGGIDIAVIESQFEILTAVDDPVMAYRKRVIFQVETGTVMLDFITLLDQKDLFLTEIDQIFDKLILLDK